MFNFQGRTDNIVEANRSVHRELQMVHLKLCKFTTWLQKMQINRNAFFEKLIGGNPTHPNLKKYVMTDGRILEIVFSFSHRFPNEYLRIAYNFYLKIKSSIKE